MKKGRVRIDENQLANRDQAENLLGELARAEIDLNTVTDKLDADLQAIREAYEGKIERLKEVIKHKTKFLNTWAQANPEEFEKKKSLDFIHGRIGFRTTTPRVTTLNRKTNAEVIELLNAAYPKYIRTTDSIDKDAIIEAYKGKLVTNAALAHLHLKVSQKETFFAAPNLEEINEQEPCTS